MVNLSEIFRSMFGLRPDILPRGFEEDSQRPYENIPDSTWYQQTPTVHGEWRIFSDHPDHHHDGFSFGEGDFFQEFEQMFQNFFRGFPFHSSPWMEAPPLLSPDSDISPEVPEKNIHHDSGQSLRDRMLRRPDMEPGMKHSDNQFGNWWRLPFGSLSGPEERVDRDFDSELESGTQCLDDILAQKDQDQSPSCTPRKSSSSSSFSSVTIIGSNGVTEQRTTKRDSSGKEEVSVTRRIGDQTHTFTRKKDESGNEETREDLLNIDHDKLVEFDEKWNESKRQGRSSPNSDGDDSSRQPMPFSSIYDAILDEFFPKRR